MILLCTLLCPFSKLAPGRKTRKMEKRKLGLVFRRDRSVVATDT